MNATTRPAAITTPAGPARRAGRRLTTAAAAVAGTAALALTLSAVAGTAAASASAAKAPQLNCAAAPSACGYPDATNTGVPAGTNLLTVPGQVSSGPGWHYDSRGWVEVTGNGASLTGLYIPMNLDITASNVTINNVQVVTSGASSFGISLRHTANVTIENSTISGVNATTGRVGNAIDDIYGDSTAMTIKNNNIANWRTAVQVSSGLVTGNYIHAPGYMAGDHVNGIYDTGSTQALTISGNTIFNSMNQTDDITLEASASGQTIANKTITGNLLAGGGYSIYGGDSLGNATSNITVRNNRFSTLYYPSSGAFGPVAYYNATDPGNAWTANTSDTTGNTITP
jgi:hypothetical protein